MRREREFYKDAKQVDVVIHYVLSRPGDDYYEACTGEGVYCVGDTLKEVTAKLDAAGRSYICSADYL